MVTHIRRSIISILVMTAVFGFVYALAGTGISQLAFHHQANGSITTNGSTLIGQDWSATKCPGHPPRQLRVPRPTRRHRAVRRRGLLLQRP